MDQSISSQAASSMSGSTTEVQAGPSIPNLPSGTLRLRAEPVTGRHIQWAEDVVDNEGMGKKSSKVCCIYHKPRAIDESSDESSDSSSGSDSDSEPDNSRARPVGGGRRHHNHRHKNGQGDGADKGPGESGGRDKGKARKRSPNAYEKMPKYSTSKSGNSR